MERNKFRHVGEIRIDEMNPTEKICDLLKFKNYEKLIEIIRKSDYAAEALHDSYVPLGELYQVQLELITILPVRRKRNNKIVLNFQKC